MKQIFVVPAVNKLEASRAHSFIIFPWFVQNQCQPRADSPKTLTHEPNGFGIKTLQHLEKFNFRCFRNRYFNHRLLLFK